MKEIYTVKEIARELGLREPAIRKHINEGKLKATYFNGGYIIKAEDYEDFKKKRAEKYKQTK